MAVSEPRAVASTLLLLEAPTVKVAALLAIAVWAFCRFYYFAFYVIQQYVDPGHRFTGLLGFLRYAAGRHSRVKMGETTQEESG